MAPKLFLSNVTPLFNFINFLAFLLQGANSTTISLKNNCPYTVWPGTLNGGGSPPLSQTGFQLDSGAGNNLTAPKGWSGRVWARTGCTTDGSGRFSCETADCGTGSVACNNAGGATPATLVEFALQADGVKDLYDVSYVEGFNLPASVAPQGGSGDCRSSGCGANINDRCPDELQVKNGGGMVLVGCKSACAAFNEDQYCCGGADGKSETCPPTNYSICELQVKNGSGAVVGCKSACVAFNQDQYCCRGAYGTSETCPPTSYSMIFSNACPDAYSYAYDDRSGIFTCSGANYLITFCP